MTPPLRSSAGRWIAPVLAGLVGGTGLQLQQAALWMPGTYWLMTLLAGAAAVALWRLARGTAWPWLPLCAVLAFALVGLRAVAFDESRLARELEGRDVEVTGIVAALPQVSEVGTRFRLRVESARLAGQDAPVPPLLALGWYGGVVASEGLGEVEPRPLELRAGDRWTLTVRLKAPHGQLNPNGFDYELWLWEQGVQATGYVRNGRRDAVPRRIAPTWQVPMEQARQRVRDAIFARVEDRRAAGVLAALVVGDQAAIERADWDVFRATGVAHLMSISGLHITMFAWAAAWVLVRLWRRSARLCLRVPAPSAALVGGVALATLYAVFSGWGVPAQRTICMLGVVALLRLAGRGWPWPWVWLLACAAVVVVDPWALLQAGFWLSFVAVGVLFAADPGSGAPGAAANAQGWRARALSLWRPLRSMLAEQGVVTLALAPLSLLLFGQVSIVGLLANLVAIPWVTLVVTPLGLAGVLWGACWEAGAAALSLLSLFLEQLAGWPAATWSAPAAPLGFGVAAVFGGVLLALRLPPAVRLLGIPLLLPALLWEAPRPAQGEFDLLAADIGQGNAVLVRTARHALLYDTGPAYSRESDAGQRVVVPLLRALGERLDLVVLSHRDSDHTGGAAAVLAMQRDTRVLGSLEAGHPLRQPRPFQRCEAPMRWQWDGVDFELLHPRAADYQGTPAPNTVSCVLRIGNGRQRLLLPGDLERAQEERLVASGADLRADVLVVPHHGSRTSSSAPWLDAVRPRLGIVQAGYRNRFGHPAADVLARYEERGTRIVGSPACGALAWRSHDPDTVTCERERARRYWHHRIGESATTVPEAP